MSRSPKKTSHVARRREIDDVLERAWRAEQHLDRAFTTDDDEESVALARSALEINPECVDAYLLLAEHAATAQAALPLLEQAVVAGVRGIGESRFRELAGHFWLALETRGYMRARQELAECLWGLGRIDEAVGHFRGLLELNPNDNQGCRYRLASILLRTGCSGELEALLDQYPDDWSAEWPYIRALLAFQSEGDSENSRRLLRAAREVNPHVPALLTGAKPLPREVPEFISPGAESEAVSFVGEFLAAWRSTSGAIPWVREVLDVRSNRERPPPRRVSWTRARNLLEQLPQDPDAEWEVDLVPLSTEASNGRPWLFLIVDAASGDSLAMQPEEDRPSDHEVWRRIIEAMRAPNGQEPRRPGRIRVSRKTWGRAWGPKLAQVGIACEVGPDLPRIQEAAEQFAQSSAWAQERASQSPLSAQQLLGLPQSVGEVWCGVVRRLPTWIQIDGRMCRPTAALVLDATSGQVISTGLVTDDPPADWLWGQLQLAMSHPAAGEPRRPGVVQVFTDPVDDGIAAQLEALDIRCVARDDLEPIDAILADLAEHLGGAPRIKPLIHASGITPEQLGGFYAAAADFYRAAPWRLIPGDSIIRIESDAFSSGPCYAVVMGQSGLELGLALYEDLPLLRRILRGRMSDAEHARQTSALSVTYSEVFDVTPQDADAVEQHGWPIADPQAYPCIMRVNPGLAIRAPLPWELELAETCLRLIPEYLRNPPVGTAMLTAPLPTRAMTLKLSREE